MFNRKAQELIAPRPPVRIPNTRIEGPDGFEPCFVREIVDGDTIAIEHPVKPGLTEMTVSRIFRTGYTIRTEADDAQWVGTLTNGQQVHCSYKQQTTIWRRPRPQEVADAEAEAFWTVPAFPQA